MLTPLYVWITATLLAIFVGALDEVSQKSAETTTVTVVEGMVNPTTHVDSPLPTSTQLCNGHASFCTRSYGNITYVGTHNSPFVQQNNVAANQNLNVTQQLTDGIRMREFDEFGSLLLRRTYKTELTFFGFTVQGQTHMLNGVLHYCHTR